MSRWVQKLGADIGGMYIQLSGADLNGKSKVLRWDLIDEEGGATIPAIPSIILVQKFATGNLDGKGAKAYVGFLRV